MNASRTISTKVPISVFDKLDAIANEKQKAKTDILREALELYIDEWSDYKIAIHRLKDQSDETMSEEQFLNELKSDLSWNV